MVHQPWHDRMVSPDLGLVPGLKCKSHSPDLTLCRLDCILHFSIGWVRSHRGLLCHHLEFFFCFVHHFPCEFNSFTLLSLTVSKSARMDGS